MVELKLASPGKNALGTRLMDSIVDRLEHARGEPLLVTGDGDAFSAGLDLKEVASLDPAGMERFLRLLEHTMSLLFLYPGPTVAAINGHAIAGGCVVALCCDVRVMTDSPRAKIGLNEVALGLRFPPRVLAIVTRRIPTRFRDEVLLGAGLFDPPGAARVGLVDVVAADPVSVARQRLDALAKHPCAAYAATKSDLRGSTAQDLASDAGLDAWFRDSLAVWTSDALRARIAAMFSK